MAQAGHCMSVEGGKRREAAGDMFQRHVPPKENGMKPSLITDGPMPPILICNALFCRCHGFGLSLLQIQCYTLSIDQHNAAVDQFLTGAFIFFIAQQSGKVDHVLN